MGGVILLSIGKETTAMKTNQEKVVNKEVIGKNDRILESIGLLTVTVIKKKYVEQIRRFNTESLPDSIAIVGVCETEGFHHIVFGYGGHSLKVGRCDLWAYADKLLRIEQPELFERSESKLSNADRYRRQRDEVDSRAKVLLTELPQLFIT
jgi:hypothetical protein